LFQQNDFVDRVKGEVSLESYISRYVKLKKAGRRVVGLCPFHSEKSPSFSISPELNVYHCFGCGKSGDIFTFVQDYEKVDFRRSMEILADYSGIPLQSQSNKEDTQFKQKLYDLNARFLSYFRENLEGSEGEQAREYLRKRGIDKKVVLKFELGYALPGFDNFTRNVVRSAEDVSFAQKLGLLKVSTSRGGSTYDFYRDRIMFPIKDPSGKILGFGGRIIRESEEAKYINSPASPIYDKGKTFYGLYQAQGSIRKSRIAILVEGYLDVIGLHSKELDTAIAPLGTSLTNNQVRNIKSYADKVKLVFDGDKAGKSAAVRAAEICLKEGLAAEIVVLEDGKDPFDLSRTMTNAEISELLTKSFSHSEFLLQETLLHTHITSSPEEKRKAIENLFTFIKSLERETDQQMYLSEGAKQLGLSISSVLNDFKRGSGVTLGDPKVDIKKSSKPLNKGNTAEVVYSRKILTILVLHPEFFSYIEQLLELDFEDGDSAFFWEVLYTKYMNSESISITILQEEGFPSDIRSTFMSYILELDDSEESEESRKNVFEEYLLLYKRANKHKELENISNGVGVLDEKDRLSRLMIVRSEILQIDQKLRTLNYTNGRG
jgi:DNA primase